MSQGTPAAAVTIPINPVLTRSAKHIVYEAISQAVPTATSFPAAGISILQDGTLGIYLMGPAAVWTVVRTRGSSTSNELLNAGVALTANSGYLFYIPVRNSETIQLQASVGGSSTILLWLYPEPEVIS